MSQAPRRNQCCHLTWSIRQIDLFIHKQNKHASNYLQSTTNHQWHIEILSGNNPCFSLSILRKMIQYLKLLNMLFTSSTKISDTRPFFCTNARNCQYHKSHPGHRKLGKGYLVNSSQTIDSWLQYHVDAHTKAQTDLIV